MSQKLTNSPDAVPCTFLNFPLVTNLNNFDADIAILGVPYGMPYESSAVANDQSRAPDAIRQATSPSDIAYTKTHFDYDLGGSLFDGHDIKVVDCGNITADTTDHKVHYRRAEQTARKIYGANTILVTLGGDHGISIPVIRALEVHKTPITLIHIDAHLDWRDEINGETEGYSSTIRRASQMPWIDQIVQIGMRGIGSARTGEVEDALAYGSNIISAYDMHEAGMSTVLDRIPDGGPYYLTIDADGIDPTIMPAVISQTPGGLTWLQIRELIHGLVNKGRVLGMDLVEIAPTHDVGNISMTHAERLICNFIGASVRAGYYG